MTEPETEIQAVNGQDAAPIVPEATAPVVDKPAPTPDDMSDLLAEYDAATAAPAGQGDSKPVETDANPVVDSLPPPSLSQETLDGLIYMKRAAAAERDAKDTGAAIASIRGEIDPSIYTDAMIGGWLQGIAANDPRVQAAWQNRTTEPQQYQRMLDTVARRFQKEHGTFPDKQATEDREAVTAAMRGASTSAPEKKPANYSRMSDAEFRDTVAKNHGYMPNV